MFTDDSTWTGKPQTLTSRDEYVVPGGTACAGLDTRPAPAMAATPATEATSLLRRIPLFNMSLPPLFGYLALDGEACKRDEPLFKADERRRCAKRNHPLPSRRTRTVGVTGMNRRLFAAGLVAAALI